MNLPEIDALPAGPELDDLIERHIYGQSLRRGWAPMPASTEIEWAWKVVEHLQAEGICLLVRPYLQGGFRVSYGTPEEIDYATAETAPLAICRAALKAKVTT
jgi:hypothetical protein